MIKDKLSNANRYYNLSAGIREGLEYLKNNDITNLEDGKYEINSDKLFINVNSYTSKDDADWESHTKYIDIQYIKIGKEKIGICDRNDCITKISYNEEKDIEFLSGEKGEFNTMEPEDFMIIFPNELHKPGIKVNENTYVKKAIIKVAVGY